MARNNGSITSGADYRILANQKTYQDYKKQNDVNILNQQLAEAKINAMNVKNTNDRLGIDTNAPSAIKIANEFRDARAKGDTQRMNDILLAGRLADRGLAIQNDGSFAPYQGYGNAVANIAGTKKGAEEQAALQQRLIYNPQIQLSEDLYKAQAADESTNPILENLRNINSKTFEGTYAGGKRILSRFDPTGLSADARNATDLLVQARLEVATPLAKQLGVNPTDKDFQASLDRIFDLNTSRESRAAQIDALDKRIKERMATRTRQLGRMNQPNNFSDNSSQQTNSLFSPFKNFQGKPIPQKSIDFLLANPNSAPLFDARYGNLSKQILNGNNGQ